MSSPSSDILSHFLALFNFQRKTLLSHQTKTPSSQAQTCLPAPAPAAAASFSHHHYVLLDPPPHSPTPSSSSTHAAPAITPSLLPNHRSLPHHAPCTPPSPSPASPQHALVILPDATFFQHGKILVSRSDSLAVAVESKPSKWLQLPRKMSLLSCGEDFIKFPAAELK